MTGSDKPAEPVGLNMSLDAIIAKRGTNAGGGRGAGRGRGGEGLAVKGGVSKPESGRGAGSFNRDQQSGGGRGQGSQRGGISGGRGGGRFAGSDGGRGRGGRGGPGMGAMPMQQQQRAPMQHFAAPGHGMGGNPANALEARLLEQARIIEMQQRQTMMLQAQLIQQQQEMAAAAAAVAQGGAWRGMQGAGTSAPASAVGVAAAAPGGRAPRQLTGRAPAVVEEPAPAPQMPDEDPPEGVECFLEEDTGNVVVMLQDSPIVTATPTGELLLSTGGWYTDETVIGMNYALKAVNMKIIVTGEVDEGNWKIADGRALTRFYEDANLGYMRVPSKGASTANRAKAILSWFQGPRAAPAAAAGPGRARMGAAQVQMEVDGNASRRLKAQGRY